MTGEELGNAHEKHKSFGSFGYRMNQSLFVDDRWAGPHGIGRYAQEVLARIRLPHESLGFGGSPSSPFDAGRLLPAAVRNSIVYSPGYNAFIHARRQVLTIHDLIHLETEWPHRGKYLAYYEGVIRPAVRRAQVVITVSETSRVKVSSWLRDDAVQVINAGIAASAVFNSAVDSVFAGAEGRIHGKRPTLLYVGNLRKHKNVGVIIGALGLVPDVELNMLVPVEDAAAARRLAVSHGVSDRVRLLPRLDDESLATAYRDACATLMPSRDEGFGLPALESVMCGTPVIYWQGCAAVRETVGNCGYVVESASNYVEWAEVMSQALIDQRRVVPPIDRYDWDRTVSVIEQVLAQTGS